MVAGLIGGSFGAPADLTEQRRFFDTHIGCWAPRFFEDLQGAQSAVLYMPVGTIGRLFMTVETQAFDMAASRHRFSPARRSAEHTSELQSLMRISYAVFCLYKHTNVYDHLIIEL